MLDDSDNLGAACKSRWDVLGALHDTVGVFSRMRRENNVSVAVLTVIESRVQVIQAEIMRIFSELHNSKLFFFRATRPS